MYLTARVKISPTEEQLKVLWEISDKCCSLYNLALAERKDAWKNERKTIKYFDQNKKLSEFKKINPEYKVVYSKTLQETLRKLDMNYKSFFALRNIDRDRNSAINIMLNFLSQNALWTGYQYFVDNLRQYRLPDGTEIRRIEAK